MSKNIYVILGIMIIVLIGGGIALFSKNGSDTACTDKTPAPRIAAFGDSLVFGYGATTDGGFVSLLSSASHVPVINLGKSGDTTSSAKERLNTVVAQKPDITFVLLGGNDALQHVGQSETEQNLADIITALQQANSRVILLGVLGGIPDRYASMYQRLADTYHVTYVPNVLSGIFGHQDLMSDPIHPNQAGYQKIADRLLPILEKECAK